jgi:galactose mutarotase-like enzyme
LRTGELHATFVPTVGMLGVSFRHAGDELLAPVTSLTRYRRGRLSGLPFLYPWANRLGAWSYDAGDGEDRARVRVARDVPTDDGGLPIHGTGPARFDVVAVTTAKDEARLVARFDATASAAVQRSFPFHHTVDLAVALTASALAIDTTIRATGEHPVPVSHGWHPYFALPGTPRDGWRLRMPARRHVPLDARQLPERDAPTLPEPAEDAPIGARRLDDHYALGRDRRFELATRSRRLTITFGRGYPYAQVYVPPGKPFACVEPMTAPVNALVDRTAPSVAPGRSATAAWRIEVTRPHVGGARSTRAR